MAVSVKMSSKNQIVVPKMARDALGLEPGDRLVVTVGGDGAIRMEKQPPDLEDRLEGSLRGVTGPGGLWEELADA
ncbi:MAG: AbrB/MazE/SpoVT family DNA-binding domain-containing protein [Gemmatimonadota bacterium]|nr:AbrB/MazE/SpoVT family DNA-binding domain-containing protein [Gemmatimonadota bacterium]